MTEKNFTPGQTQDCLICPICVTFAAIRQTNPEVMEHVLKAGHELYLAVSAFTAGAAEKLDRNKPLQHVKIT